MRAFSKDVGPRSGSWPSRAAVRDLHQIKPNGHHLWILWCGRLARTRAAGSAAPQSAGASCAFSIFKVGGQEFKIQN
jgi:hypothetical protein